MAAVHLLRTDDVPDDLLVSVRSLLCDAFDGDFSDEDWAHALGGWHAIVTLGTEVVSHAAVVARIMDVGGTPLRSGYVEAVATSPREQRRGHGSLAMARLGEVILREFELGLLSTGSHRFYEALGWERWRGPTFVLRHGQRVRTPHDDDGVMALRFGPSLGLPLTAPITCHERSGDDW